MMFKKIVIFLIGAVMLPSVAMAQKDWANVVKYAQANTEVKVKPIAVLMGDSITEGWFKKDPEFFSANNFVGRGISGQTTSHMLCRFRQDVVVHAPKYVVILAGTNDIALNNGPITLENIFANIVSMCDIAKANKIKPILCSVVPCAKYRWRPEITDAAEQIVALNAMLKEYAAKKRLVYVDYHTAMRNDEGALPVNLSNDGCHPTIDGYKIMEKILLEAMKIK
jgi:lysophospholipase L1-like esterase